MVLRWSVLGAPSSAGARTPGVELAPGALRSAGLVTAIEDRGIAVQDLGDIAGFRWRPDLHRPTAQNAGAVARVALETGKAVATAQGTPLVLGGDATVTVGLVAGTGRQPALVYLGGPDLYTPETRPQGNLDAMGLAHLLAVPGCDPLIASIASVSPRQVVLYGDELPPDDYESRLAARLRLTHIRAEEVRTGPAKSAARARFAVEDAAEQFVVHFDAGVLRFGEAPFADDPESGGLTLPEATRTLAVLTASPQFAGLAITGVNPQHVPDGTGLGLLVSALATALA